MTRALAAGAAAVILAASGAAARAGQVPPPQALVPVKISTPDGIVPAFVDRKTVDGIFVPLFAHEDQHGANEFTSGEPYRVQFELFFDTYEQKQSVRELTDKIEKLALVHPGTRRPPVALLTWGTGLTFKCILESFSLRFTLFLEDGTPVRATMGTVWKEFSPVEEQSKGPPRH